MSKAKARPSPRWSEYLSAQLLEVDLRLANWARWAYERLGGPGHCGSVEHRYVPGRDDERAEALQKECSEPIDALDAVFVEGCVTRLPVISRERVFLRSYYIGRHHWRQTCRILRINPDLFPSAHVRTVTIVGGIMHVVREGASPAPAVRDIVAPAAPSANHGAYRLPVWGSVSR